MAIKAPTITAINGMVKKLNIVMNILEDSNVTKEPIPINKIGAIIGNKS